LKRPTNAEIEDIKLVNEKGDLSEMLEGTIEDIYYRSDTAISNSIDYEEFKEFFETVGEAISQPDFNTKILGKYCSTERGLTEKGFKEFWKD
jgi:hypothetical protein